MGEKKKRGKKGKGEKREGEKKGRGKKGKERKYRASRGKPPQWRLNGETAAICVDPSRNGSRCYLEEGGARKKRVENEESKM